MADDENYLKKAEDLRIQEEALKKELSDLQRELHMKEVRKLSRKQRVLTKLTVQRKQMTQLEKQIKELEPTVIKPYSADRHIKDNQMKGYLIYLLQLKEQYEREVQAKKEMIRLREEQITKLFKKICVMENEYATKIKSAPRKAPEFILLENMSNKMNQLQKRVSMLQYENKNTLESIKDMSRFLKQYKKLEKDLRSKIKDMKEKAQKHLDRAVLTYEEREDFINKKNMFEERFSHDLRQAAVNENELHRIQEKTQNFEEFGELQKNERSDARIATTGELIEQGITGLEPELTRVQDFHSAIVASSGRETPEEMDAHFKVTDDQANSQFSYLEELLEMIHREQNEVDELRENNNKLLKGMSNQERRMRWEIKDAQAEAKDSRAEADNATESVTEARSEMDDLSEKVRSLYLKCCAEEKKIMSEEQKEEADISETPQVQGMEDKEIDDSNATEFNEELEKKILELLTIIEYKRMKEVGNDEFSQEVLSLEESLKTSQATEEPGESENNPDPHSIPDMDLMAISLIQEESKSEDEAAVHEIKSDERNEDS